MNIQTAIADYVENQGIKKTILARRCGWPPQKMYALLNGHQKLSAVDYGTLCEVLEVPVDYFYCISKQSSSCE